MSEATIALAIIGLFAVKGIAVLGLAYIGARIAMRRKRQSPD